MHSDIPQNWAGWASLSVPNHKSQSELPAFSPVSFPHCLTQSNVSLCSPRSNRMTSSLEMTSSTTGKLQLGADNVLQSPFTCSAPQPWAVSQPLPGCRAAGLICLHTGGTKSCQENSANSFAPFYFCFFFFFFPQLLVVPSWKEAQLLLSLNSPRLVDYLLNGNGRLKLFSLKNSSFKA